MIFINRFPNIVFIVINGSITCNYNNNILDNVDTKGTKIIGDLH